MKLHNQELKTWEQTQCLSHVGGAGCRGKVNIPRGEADTGLPMHAVPGLGLAPPCTGDPPPLSVLTDRLWLKATGAGTSCIACRSQRWTKQRIRCFTQTFIRKKNKVFLDQKRKKNKMCWKLWKPEKDRKKRGFQVPGSLRVQRSEKENYLETRRPLERKHRRTDKLFTMFTGQVNNVFLLVLSQIKDNFL